MSDNKSAGSTGNIMLDAWMRNQEQFIEAQSQWMNVGSNATETLETTDLMEQAQQRWKKCEEQFKSWSSLLETWTPTEGNFSEGVNAGVTTETLKRMMDPSSFFKSGADQISETFNKLVNGVDFADIGVMEKQYLKTGADWVNLRKANGDYQAVLAGAWSRAFETYSVEFSKGSDKANPLAGIGEGGQTTSKALLDMWLKIADKELINTLRSDEYLKAQSNLFSASTEYKLKHRKIIEVWCEANSIPTRTEVDDLHQMVYSMRREIRQLKRQLKDDDNRKVQVSEKPISKRAIKKEAVPAKLKTSKKVASKKVASKKVASKKVASKKVASKKVTSKKVASKKATSTKPTKKITAKKKAVSKKAVGNNVVKKKVTKKKVAKKKVITKKRATEKS